MEVKRVQAVAASLSKEKIPTEFIRLETEQPAITTFHVPIPEIPTVDLSDSDLHKVVVSVAKASREWGIFQVVNHGIPEELIGRLQSVGKEFFELPVEEKEKYSKPPGTAGIKGYGSKLQKDPDGKRAWVDRLFHKIWPSSTIN